MAIHHDYHSFRKSDISKRKFCLCILGQKKIYSRTKRENTSERRTVDLCSVDSVVSSAMINIQMEVIIVSKIVMSSRFYM